MALNYTIDSAVAAVRNGLGTILFGVTMKPIGSTLLSASVNYSEQPSPPSPPSQMGCGVTVVMVTVNAYC